MLTETITDEEDEFEEEGLEDRIYGISDFDSSSLSEFTMLYKSEPYEEPLMSWDSEDDYWYKDVQSTISSSSDDLISFITNDEINKNSDDDEILISTLPPLNKSQNDFNMSCGDDSAIIYALQDPRQVVSLLAEEANKPIIDLFDFYFEKRDPNVSYQIENIPKSLKKILRIFYKSINMDLHGSPKN
ncbi:6310_t:CDS:1 [Racocetra persica]|uniref:6310_t:CDS:1 n=1 Tax=Racocetra persica TaxID=160502 RepID=A0ACA9L5E4_9GLOM|nr:6310_t:CDS:1 [Racocetra persica]